MNNHNPPPTPHNPRLIIHGGAGNITRTNLPPPAYLAYRTALLSILHTTAARLHAGASALDAATHAVRLLEENPLFNCGRGAVFARDGSIELEASVMVSRGRRKRGVGVALLKHVRNPVLLAREVLVRGEVDGGGAGGGDDGGDGDGDSDPSGGSGGAQGHVQLSGRVVEGLARGWGLEMVGEGWFWTRRRWEEHRRGLERDSHKNRGEEGKGWDEEEEDAVWERKLAAAGGGGCGDVDGFGDPGWDGHEYLPQGTAGCVALDAAGTLCVATSTGGLTNKLPGRIGDTPTLGAGFWAEEWRVERPVAWGPRPADALSPLQRCVPGPLRELLAACLPGVAGYSEIPVSDPSEGKASGYATRAVAMSGTGNGDSFLRIAGVRTAAAIARFAPHRSLASAVAQIAGVGGELQQSAGDRWRRTGEGEGGIIGIEVVDGRGTVVFDFNCGGMFRTWVDDDGAERVMVFKEEY